MTVSGSRSGAGTSTGTGTGTGDSLQVDDASVVCGDDLTSNANLYLIDTVIMPKS